MMNRRQPRFDATPDYDPNELARRNQLLDAGRDPDNPMVGLVDSTGQSIAGSRSIMHMLEGLRLGGPGTRTLYGAKLNEANNLNNGSGSVYDNMDTGGDRYSIPGNYKPPVTAGQWAQHAKYHRESEVAAHGFDPHATPEESAQSFRAALDVARAKENDAAAHAHQALRQTAMNVTALDRRKVPGSGGLIVPGAHLPGDKSLRPAPALPDLSGPPPIEGDHTPEEYVGEDDRSGNGAERGAQSSGMRPINPLEVETNQRPTPRARVIQPRFPDTSPSDHSFYYGRM